MSKSDINTTEKTTLGSVFAPLTGETGQENRKEQKPKTEKKRQGKKRKKKLKKVFLWLLVLLLLGGFVAYKLGFIGKNGVSSANAETYNTFTVMRRDIENILTGTGTLQPADSYNVTALSSGEILEEYFEEGDEVAEDQLLMKIDSSNLESSVERAQNTYDKAKENLDDLYEDRAKLQVTTDYAGTIQVMNIEVGDEIMNGTVVASVLDRETMLIDIPFMQADTFSITNGMQAVLTVGNTLEEIYGTVREIKPSYSVNENGVKIVEVTIAVQNPGGITENTTATAKIGDYACTKAASFYYNVNEQILSETSGKVVSILKDEGMSVYKGEVVLVLESETLDKNIKNAERSLKEASDSLEDAYDAFDNYEITAPISGTVIEKNYKRGEKIGSGSNGSNIVAVIYDMSSLKFSMNIDELDIDSLAVGKQVNITSDAKPGKTYIGEITNISVQGTTSNGTTYYPITVTLTNYGSEETGDKLRPGMNIDAEIILEKAENVLAVPVDAVGRGNKVKVIKKDTVTSENAQTPEMPDDKGTLPQNMQMPEGIQPPEGMELPEDMQMPEGMEMPEGMTLPETGRTPGGYSTVPKSAEYTEVTVETGISDDDYIEIVSGLNEGDIVIVESAASTGSMWGNMGNMGGMGMMGMGGGMAMGGMSGPPSGGMGGPGMR